MSQKSAVTTVVQQDVAASKPSPTLLPITLLEKAIERGTDMEQLKQLMDLQERWEKKEARKKFFDALAEFQARVPEIKKNKSVIIRSEKGGYNYKFADLGTIKKTIQPILMATGLSYRWEFSEHNGNLRVTCLLSHRDGHTECTSMEAPADTSGNKNTIQQKGSTHTYLQRYTLIGALGLATADEDNDGRGSQPAAQAPKNESRKELSEDEVLDQWRQLVKNARTRTELTSLYLKNRKTVDASPGIQKIFKAREAELKKQEASGANSSTKPQLP